MGAIYSEPACQSAYVGDLHQLFGLLKVNPSSLNAQDPRSGDTPLIAACRRGKLKVVRYLLENEADAHLTNKKQRTCLHYVSKRTLSLVDFLLIAILMPILLLGYFLLLQKQRRGVAIMRELLSAEVDINAVDYKGNTALHYVCQKKNVHLVPVLLEGNADASVKNHDGETALDIATRLKFKKIITLLQKSQ